MTLLPCFKAYDVRGKTPSELNPDLAWSIARAYCDVMHPRTVAVGKDVRLSSDALHAAVVRGVIEGGADVVDLGLCGTEEIYFATSSQWLDGGIMVTASHNPAEYNGIKFVGRSARPLKEEDFKAIGERASAGYTPRAASGRVYRQESKEDFVKNIVEWWGLHAGRRLKVVMDAGNGCAGPLVRAFAESLPLDVVPVRCDPDGTFPTGVPNPLLQENRAVTSKAVIDAGADLGIAWDGDGDRCFFFDDQGQFIEGYYIVGLLAEAMLASHPRSKIVHDPRLYWNTVELVEAASGVPVMSKTGHAFMKARMREVDAIYGGEMSAHHYFKDFAYCDSGMIPWVLMASKLSHSKSSLSEKLAARMSAYPCSGEINRQVANTSEVIAHVREKYQPLATKWDELDGISGEFGDWRFNLRSSNTEPLLRLNVESRGDRDVMQARLDELLAEIQPFERA